MTELVMMRFITLQYIQVSDTGTYLVEFILSAFLKIGETKASFQ